MVCSSCSRRSSSRKGNPTSNKPDVVVDFTAIGATETRIRSGNGQQYSIFSPLVKMRPPTGWSFWVSVKGHSHFIDGNSPQEVVNNVIKQYATNDIVLSHEAAWYNSNRIWVSTLSNNHVYASMNDLNAIAKSLQDPLIWNPQQWDKIKHLTYALDYDSEAVKVELFRLFTVAKDRLTGCEVCYDELTQNPYNIDDQDAMKQWIEDRYIKIVTANG